MPEADNLAEEVVAQEPRPARSKSTKPAKPAQGLAAMIRKRWRAWLRAVHRDVGYFAVGFTVLYAMSGFAMNHIDDWDPNFNASEATIKISPLADELSDAEAVSRIAAAAGMTGKPDDVYRAGDEVRLSYASGSKVTAIGDTVTVQIRRDRFFFRVADWLHATRGKQAWKFISDVYAVFLFYLAISGLFMIKGRLGLRWRGLVIAGLGLAVPIGYIIASGGPGAQKTEKVAARPGEVDPPKPDAAGPGKRPTGMKPLPPDDDEPATKPSESPPSREAARPREPARPGEPVKPNALGLKPRADGLKPLPPDDEDEAPAKTN